MARPALPWFTSPGVLLAIIALLACVVFLLDGASVSDANRQGLPVPERDTQKAVLDFHAAMLKNMSMRVQTAEQALLDLRQAHLDLRKKHDEATALRRATRAVAQRGGGPPPAPEASPAAPEEATEEAQRSEVAEDIDGEDQDGAEGPASEEQQKAEEEEQRKLIGYNEVTKTFKRFRPDFKCGSRVPLLPDDEVVECDRLSVTPCCSALGWCGRTKGHCRCATCIDYRKETGGSQINSKR